MDVRSSFNSPYKTSVQKTLEIQTRIGSRSLPHRRRNCPIVTNIYFNENQHSNVFFLGRKTFCFPNECNAT